MQHHNFNEVGTSTAALVIGFNSVFPVADYDQGVVDLYSFLADVGVDSNVVFNALEDPRDGVPGVWAYEVDHECGAWIGKQFKELHMLPARNACKAKLEELGRIMMRQQSGDQSRCDLEECVVGGGGLTRDEYLAQTARDYDGSHVQNHCSECSQYESECTCVER
ncbi:hypothetical protein [Burkholderia vietnamiensis]|uniref:hypothetical protein n=1 Tax=Burkholderia vietnamiensis TaxID=60552 RepID=UPI001592D6BC|nr:hypothetical protein [Burkholderia vietnamiensis]